MATRMKAGGNARAKPVPKTPRPCVWVKIEAGRGGVPLLRSFKRSLEAIPELRRRRGMSEVNILIVDAEAGRRCNRQFRARDYATNVLSLPWEPMPGEPSGLLGDFVICTPVVAREASEQQERARPFRPHDDPRRAAPARPRPRGRCRTHGGASPRSVSAMPIDSKRGVSRRGLRGPRAPAAIEARMRP
jgi:probable rRNA maturation factor